MPFQRRPHPVAMFVTWLLVVFNVLFPKGGIKAGGVPLTWGYGFIGLTVPMLFFYRFLALPLRFSKLALCALLCLLPMQILMIYSGVTYGLENPPFAVANIVNLMVLPWIFFVLYAPCLFLIDGYRLAQYLRWSILLAALWGILLFFLHPITGHYIEIPLLTVNAADYGQLEATKHNARGLFPKLISTYNNGNIYGVAMLILLPLYERIETKSWARLTIKVALVFTLSRTVWAGLLAYEAIPIVMHFVRQSAFFPRLYLGKTKGKIVAFLFTGGAVVGSLALNGNSFAFLFDRSGGGRSYEFSLLFSSGFVPTRGLAAFGETVYSSVAFAFGYVGLVCFVLMMASPIVLLLVDSSALNSPSRRAALKGLILYMVLAAVDGAIGYIPVMLFFWFAYLIYICGWPGEKSGAYAFPTPEPARFALWRKLKSNLPSRKPVVAPSRDSAA